MFLINSAFVGKIILYLRQLIFLKYMVHCKQSLTVYKDEIYPELYLNIVLVPRSRHTQSLSWKPIT
jgi:hypothetical protein